MATITEKQKDIDIRKRLSIELLDNFMRRLNPAQKYETKIAAIIAIRNFVIESKMDDPMLLNHLVDAIVDPDESIREILIKVIKEIIHEPNVKKEIIELLEIKQKEATLEINKEITTLINTSHFQLLPDGD